MSTLVELDRQECLALLRTVRLGRVVYTDRALPAVGPASFAVVGTSLLLRPIEDGLAARLDGQVVAFEVGDLGRRPDAGWSVVVTGSARLLRPTTDLARREPAGLAAGHSGPLSLTPGAITGRRVLPAHSAPVLFGPPSRDF